MPGNESDGLVVAALVGDAAGGEIRQVWGGRCRHAIGEIDGMQPVNAEQEDKLDAMFGGSGGWPAPGRWH
jgi:hypothetical protein